MNKVMATLMVGLFCAGAAMAKPYSSLDNQAYQLVYAPEMSEMASGALDITAPEELKAMMSSTFRAMEDIVNDLSEFTWAATPRESTRTRRMRRCKGISKANITIQSDLPVAVSTSFKMVPVPLPLPEALANEEEPAGDMIQREGQRRSRGMKTEMASKVVFLTYSNETQVSLNIGPTLRNLTIDVSLPSASPGEEAQQQLSSDTQTMMRIMLEDSDSQIRQQEESRPNLNISVSSAIYNFSLSEVSDDEIVYSLCTRTVGGINAADLTIRANRGMTNSGMMMKRVLDLPVFPAILGGAPDPIALEPIASEVPSNQRQSRRSAMRAHRSYWRAMRGAPVDVKISMMPMDGSSNVTEIDAQRLFSINVPRLSRQERMSIMSQAPDCITKTCQRGDAECLSLA